MRLNNSMSENINANAGEKRGVLSRHLLSEVERNFRLILDARCAVDFRAAFLFSGEAVERGHNGNGCLAVAARHFDIDAAEAPLAVVLPYPTEHARKNEALPRFKRKEFPGERSLDVDEQRTELANRSAFTGSNSNAQSVFAKIVNVSLARLLHIKAGRDNSSHNSASVIKTSFDMRI
jgi:hypothetical protein